jgi:hypothetical protein
MKYFKKIFPFLLLSLVSSLTAQRSIMNFKLDSTNTKPISMFQNRPNYYESLPVFCKLEYKMGVANKLPVKFRLGDVEYVDMLEGKRK